MGTPEHTSISDLDTRLQNLQRERTLNEEFVEEVLRQLPEPEGMSADALELRTQRTALQRYLEQMHTQIRQQKLSLEEVQQMSLHIEQYREAIDLFRFRHIAYKGLTVEIPSDEQPTGVLRLYDMVVEQKEQVLLSLMALMDQQDISPETVRSLLRAPELSDAFRSLKKAPSEPRAGSSDDLDVVYNKLLALRGPVLLEILEGPGETQQKVDSVIGLAKEYGNLLEMYEVSSELPIAEQESKRERGLESFKDAMSLEGIGTQQLQRVLDALFAPLPHPSTSMVTMQENQQQALLGMHVDIQERLQVFESNVQFMIFRLQSGESLSEEQGQAFGEELLLLLLERDKYERALNPTKRRERDFFSIIGGLVLVEAVEEFAQAAYGMGPSHLMEMNSLFGTLPSSMQEQVLRSVEGRVYGSSRALSDEARKILDESLKSKVLPTPEGIEHLDSATRRGFMRGIADAQQRLAERGMSTKEFDRLVRKLKFNESLGGRALNRLRSYFNSPADFVIYSLYIGQSENKLRAAMSLTCFISISALSNVMVDKTILAAIEARYGKAALSKFKIGPPALRFAVAIFICFGLHKQVSQAMGWLDETIPDSAWKEGANSLLGTVFLDRFYKEVDWRQYDTGLRVVDPEHDWVRVLSTGTQRIERGGPFRTDYIRTVEDWNELVDKAIRETRSPEQRALFELEKINEPWRARKAFEMRYELTNLSLNLRSQLEQKLEAQFGEVTDEDRAGMDLLIEIATADEGTGRARNDKAFERALDGNDAQDDDSLNVLNEKIQALEDGDPLKEQWIEFVARGRYFSKCVSVLQYLKLDGKSMYSREEWFGSPGDWNADDAFLMTDLAKEGLMQTLIYTARREEAGDFQPPDILYGVQGASGAAERLGGGLGGEEERPDTEIDSGDSREGRMRRFSQGSF